RGRRRGTATRGRPRHITVPPSTHSTWPVMYAASSEARKANAPATSSGSAKRPSGMRSSVLAANLGFVRTVSVIAVAASGATALTVMPRLASSRAADFVSPTIAAFAAAHGARATRLGEAPRPGRADAGARPRDERDPPLKSAHQYDLGRPRTCSPT